MCHSSGTEESKSAWGRCVAHLIVGGSMFAGTTVVLLQSLPLLVHGLP
ncbi:hypothetical protein SAMN05443247_08681 [Bradyrhizobium erythrophlei]|jgi:hypothetical protein|nr:hypothetical protein SAMN05443247_08681 [Bradyrhizobium erythrophlei]